MYLSKILGNLVVNCDTGGVKIDKIKGDTIQISCGEGNLMKLTIALSTSSVISCK